MSNGTLRKEFDLPPQRGPCRDSSPACPPQLSGPLSHPVAAVAAAPHQLHGRHSVRRAGSRPRFHSQAPHPSSLRSASAAAQHLPRTHPAFRSTSARSPHRRLAAPGARHHTLAGTRPDHGDPTASRHTPRAGSLARTHHRRHHRRIAHARSCHPHGAVEPASRTPAAAAAARCPWPSAGAQTAGCGAGRAQSC